MARQPQVVTAVIRPCKSPVPKEPRRPALARHVPATNTKAKSSASSPRQQLRPRSGSNASLKAGFTRPTASTILKSRCPSNASSDGKASKNDKTRASVGLPKRKEPKGTPSNASAPGTMQRPRKPQLPLAARRRKTTSSSDKSRPSGTAASSASGSTKRQSSPVSSRIGNSKKSASLSSRAPQTSSRGQKSSGISGASTRTRYPQTTSATSGSGRRRSPSPSSGRSQVSRAASRAASPRLTRSASHEARMNQLKNQVDHLRRPTPRCDSPSFASPEFTSTRTNLAGRSRSPSPVRPKTAASSPWKLTGNSSALFQSPRRAGAPPRSRSRSPRGAPAGSARSCSGGTTWVETHNRAAQLGAGGRPEPPLTWQTRRDLPRVSYPRPALRSRSSSSQTRHASGDERVTLRSRGGGGSRCAPASPRRAGAAPAAQRRAGAGRAGVKRPAASGSPRRAAPATIDYSPQSRYMSGLLKRGAVRRPAGRAGRTDAARLRDSAGNRRPGKENRRPGSGSRAGSRPGSRADSEAGRPPCGRCGSVGQEGYWKDSRREPGRRESTASQRSAASEPVKSARKPARSILRTSVSSNRAASDPAPRHSGYDWVSNMLDLSAPLPKSKRHVESARKFRDNNWNDTHARHDWQETASRSSDRQPEHKCVHEYYINSRLFPVPLYTDGEGRSQCPVCLAVGPAPAAQRRQGHSRSPGPARGGRSRSPGPVRGGRSRSPGPARGARPRSRSPVPSRAGGRSRSPVPSRAAPFGSPASRGARSRSRSPAGSRAGRPRSRSVTGAPRGVGPRRPAGGGRRRASPARRRSSVSWNDEVALASSAAPSRSSRTSRTNRSPSPGGSGGDNSLCITCPNCRQVMSVSAAELSDALSDSLEPPRGRRPARGPAPASAPAPRPQPVEDGRSPQRGHSPAPGGRGRRSPVTLRSRPPTSRQPVQAMFTVPTALFKDAREECGGCSRDGKGAGTRARDAAVGPSLARTRGVPLGPPGLDWDAASFAERDPLEPDAWPGQAADPRRAGHPLWPRQLDLSPGGVRPIARGWPRPDTRGDLGRATDRLERAGRVTGRDPAPRRSVQSTSGAGGVKNTYSLRRCIGEKI